MAKSISALKRNRDRARRKASRYLHTALEWRRKAREDRKAEKRLRETLQTARRRYDHLEKVVRDLRGEIATEEREPKRAALSKQLQVAIANRKKAGDRVNHIVDLIDELRGRREESRQRVVRALRKRRFWKKRLRFTIVKLAKARELRKKRQRRNPRFEPWMANGCDWQNTNDATRAFVARMVVRHGLTTTSMNRTYVPPGGSTTSYHLSGKAADVAASWDAMIEAQKDEYRRQKGDGDCLELFGPDNGANLKYGTPLALAEGSGLETLHDTHVHGAYQ